jgi:hypothetical protein
VVAEGESRRAASKSTTSQEDGEAEDLQSEGESYLVCRTCEGSQACNEDHWYVYNADAAALSHEFPDQIVS